MTDKPKSTRLRWVLTIVGLAITSSIFNSWQKERMREQETERIVYNATHVTVVFIPGPDGRMLPYIDVQILEQGVGFVKFRWPTGQVVEHHGTYRIETNPR